MSAICHSEFKDSSHFCNWDITTVEMGKVSFALFPPEGVRCSENYSIIQPGRTVIILGDLEVAKNLTITATQVFVLGKLHVGGKIDSTTKKWVGAYGADIHAGNGANWGSVPFFSTSNTVEKEVAEKVVRIDGKIAVQQTISTTDYNTALRNMFITAKNENSGALFSAALARMVLLIRRLDEIDLTTEKVVKEYFGN